MNLTEHIETQKAKNMGKKLYDESFYNSQIDGSYRSASLYAQHLLKIFKPHSVADLGCGRGTWLKAFGENGVARLVGFDGNWNSQEKMVDQAVTFIPVDLNQPFVNPVDRFDLAISLEVAEHLKEESSKTFVKNITSLSDAVMFGAAYTKQRGTDHINEQPHTYWAKMFIEIGYIPYDLFRSTFWGNHDVEYWYQQNTFLYVKNTSELNQTLKQAGHQPISNIEFMNCVHPILYDEWVSPPRQPVRILVKKLLIKIIPKNLQPFAIKLKKQLFNKR